MLRVLWKRKAYLHVLDHPFLLGRFQVGKGGNAVEWIGKGTESDQLQMSCKMETPGGELGRTLTA